MADYVTKALESLSQNRVHQVAEEIKKQGRIIYGQQIFPGSNDRKIYYLDSTNAKMHTIGHLDMVGLLHLDRFTRKNKVQDLYEHAAWLICQNKLPV